MSAIFLLSVCLTYWPRKYTTRVDPTLIISTKFEVDMTIHCRVTAFSSAATSRDLVTLTFDLLTLSSCHTWRVMWPTLSPSLKTLRLFVHKLRVITVPIDYHWKCVRGHCACAESRDPWVRSEKRLRFWNPRPRFTYSLYDFGGSTMNFIKVICENNARPVLKNVWDSAHARNHVTCWRWPKCLIAVVFVDVDLPYWTSKVEHIVSFTASFSNICTAHAAKRLFVNFRYEFRHRRSIRRPRFPVRVQNFGELATFSVDFFIIYAECPPYFYFRFIWPTDLESIPDASTHRPPRR